MSLCRISPLLGALLVAALGAGCRTPVPLFDDLGSHGRKVTTVSPEAQRYFDQGLVLAYAFNHDEAIRAFEEAARLDPDCPMAYWGIALSNGPHINNPVMDADHSAAAWEALERAVALSERAGPREQALIRALERRYSNPPPEDRKPLDEAYAAAMREVWRAHPDDADVGTHFAEAMMDLRPWDLWTAEGKPQPGTEEVVATLERVIEIDPDHPGALHLYIHAVEASPNPERGVFAADRLAPLVPGAGHLVHMPAHIYIRVGRFADASAANERAVATDRAYRAKVPDQGFYHIYMAHNHHFLSFAAMMEGRSHAALAAARAMLAGIPQGFARDQALYVDGYLCIALEALMRFGRWELILAEPKPAEYSPVTRAYWHFARGSAYGALGRLEEAEREQEALGAAIERVSADAVFGINPARQVLDIAVRVLASEVAFRRGDTEVALAEMRTAARLEDGLQYMEPPDWIQPVRHGLGAMLIRTKQFPLAEAAYREDLARFPENGWSLRGLAVALRGQGREREAAEVEARFAKSWARADVELSSSCFCLPGA